VEQVKIGRCGTPEAMTYDLKARESYSVYDVVRKVAGEAIRSDEHECCSSTVESRQRWLPLDLAAPARTLIIRFMGTLCQGTLE